MSQRHSFTIGGAEFSLTREEVERKLRNVKAESVRLAVAAGLLRSGFTTQDAVRVFRRLSLSLGEV